MIQIPFQNSFSKHQNIKMKFLTTLRCPLMIWQILGTAQFIVINKSIPVKNTNLNFFAVFLLLIYFIMLIIGIAFPSTYLNWANDAYINMNELFSQMSIRLTACVIMAESILKLNKQIHFLQKIIEIDFIFRQKLQIKLDYKNEQFQNKNLSVIWIVYLNLGSICIFFVVYTFYDAIDIQFWLWYMVPFLLYSMQYHRIVVYVRLILRRYKILNQYIENVSSLQEKNADNSELLVRFKEMASVDFADFPEPAMTNSQLIDIRNVYQILYETTDLINDMFWWSLPLCILIDFHRFLVNCFYIFAVFLLEIEFHLLSIAFIWCSINIAHLILLSHACHSTCKEVRSKFFFCVQKRHRFIISANENMSFFFAGNKDSSFDS